MSLNENVSKMRVCVKWSVLSVRLAIVTLGEHERSVLL